MNDLILGEGLEAGDSFNFNENFWAEKGISMEDLNKYYGPTTLNTAYEEVLIKKYNNK